MMRFLNSNDDMLSLDVLISNEQVREDFRKIIDEANGIIIVSGPTGSGKTTDDCLPQGSIYSRLEKIDHAKTARW